MQSSAWIVSLPSLDLVFIPVPLSAAPGYKVLTCVTRRSFTCPKHEADGIQDMVIDCMPFPCAM